MFMSLAGAWHRLLPWGMEVLLAPAEMFASRIRLQKPVLPGTRNQNTLALCLTEAEGTKGRIED